MYTTRKVLGSRADIVRPQDLVATEGFLIFNAPRPLIGHVEWRGDFIHGVYYAAVDPSLGDGQHYIQRNIALYGHVLEFVSEAEVRESLQAHYNAIAPQYNIDVSEHDIKDLWHSYCNFFNN